MALDGEITVLIEQWRSGSKEAADKLIEKVYPELKRIAGSYVRNERLNHTLTPTALVNELYLKFVAPCPLGVESRTQFFGLAARTLRHILVDYARLHRAKKRGGHNIKITLTGADARLENDTEDLLSVHEALDQLQELDLRLAQIVELKFFVGLSEDEIAEVLEVAKITVQRDWRTARAWLITRLQSGKVQT